MTDIQSNLQKTVNFLAREIGSRGYLQTEALERTAEYIRSELGSYGYPVYQQPYNADGRVYRNIFTEIKGTLIPERIIVVGAHYDTVTGTPGADDNASGIAGLLELARLLRGKTLQRTVQFVAFTLEEPPFFRSRHQGSYMYARNLNESNAAVEGMICLEMIGYFSDEPESQLFPLPFFRWKYPTEGNFIMIVSNLHSRTFMGRIKHAFQKGTDLPVESFTGLPVVPGVDFSDHRPFWKFGYNAVMVTDTSFYRNPQYHGPGDVPQILDYERMAKVVTGLRSAIEELAGQGHSAD